MWNKLSLFAVISTLGLLVVSELIAQQGMMWREGGGWGQESPYGRMYDAHTVETMSGEVVRIEPITSRSGMSYGVHIVVKSKQGEVSVHLGPGWYLENLETRVELMDKVEIKGSRIIYKRNPAIIANEIRKGNQVLTLRDDNGSPVWSGWRQGR